jgi:hypothetical protein
MRKQQLHRTAIDRLAEPVSESATDAQKDHPGPGQEPVAAGRFLKMVALRKQQMLDRILLDEG